MTRMAYKINEVANTLGLGRTTVYKLIKQGELKHFKIGSATLITADSIEAFYERHAT